MKTISRYELWKDDRLVQIFYPIFPIEDIQRLCHCVAPCELRPIEIADEQCHNIIRIEPPSPPGENDSTKD